MKNKNIGLTVFCQLVFMASLVFCSKNVSAYSIQITTNDNIVADVSPEGNGVSIHRESIRVVSNCRNGYNLSIATSESSNLYIDGDNSNPGSFSAVDGTSALNSNDNTNKWGYTLTSSPSGNTVFSPLSTTAAPLKTSAQTASPSRDINDNFYIHYGLKADYSLTPGSYQMANDGVIIYYLIMDATCTQYTVAYNANGGTGTMASQTLQEGESANLTAKAFTAPTGASYTDANNNTINGDANKLWVFWGWNTAADGTGDWYKDKEAITDLGNSGDTVTLYAQWKQATLSDMTAGTQVGTEKVIDHNLMQDMLPETCYNSDITTAANAPAATLLDYRGKVTTGDNPESPEQYTVSKLADGLCWMTTNLNLGRSGTDGPNGNGTITLTPDDTDITYNYTLPAHSTTSSTTSNIARIRITNNSGNNNNGTYYSFMAAVLNSNDFTNPTYTTSVCPKGWDLPSNTQFTNLQSKSSYSSSNRPTAAPSSFLASGGFTNGATFYQTGSYGFYWTGTRASSTVSYGARVSSTSITVNTTTGTTYGNNRYYEKNVRCITSQGRATINYDSNGTNEHPVTGTVANQENVEINSNNSMDDSSLTRTNWVFTNWNTAADGSGTTIATATPLSSLNLKPGETITLYAQWVPQQQIIYNDNCSYNSTGCASNADTTHTSVWTNAGSNITLGSSTYFTTKTNYYIASWNTERDGSGINYNAGSRYTVPPSITEPGQITLYAQWLPQYTITYVNNCRTYASSPCTQTVSNSTKDQKINLSASGDGSGTLGAYNYNSWTLSGWKIKGWSTVADNSSGIYTEYPVSSTYTITGQSSGGGITLYAHWVPVYSIQYDGNGASNSNGMGTTNASGIKSVRQINVGEGDPVMLLPSNFKRSGHSFAGWSTDPDAWAHFTDNDITNDTRIYGPMETIEAPERPNNTNNILTFYAIWVPAETSGGNPVYLQDFGSTECANLASATFDSDTGNIYPGSVIALTDKRDNQVYTIAKLADDKCWMVENLRLDNQYTVGQNQNDPTVTNESLSQGYGGVPGTYGTFVGLANSETTNFSYSTTANSLYSTTTSGDKNVIGTSDAQFRIPRYNNSNTNNLVDSTTYAQNYGNPSNITYDGTNYPYSNIYSYGNYYNWPAAMANTGNYLTSSASEAVETSICPTGWILPTGGAAPKDFGLLSQGYGGTGGSQNNLATGGDIISNRLRTFPNNFIFSGNYNSGSSISRGSSGSYWSRSISYQEEAGSNSISPISYSPITSSMYKFKGCSVRCIVGGS